MGWRVSLMTVSTPAPGSWDSGFLQEGLTQLHPPDGQEEAKDRTPRAAAKPRALLLHTILMQLMVPLEIVIRLVWIFQTPSSP